MAKVDRPIFSDEACGRLGTALSFQKRKVFATVCPQFSRRKCISEEAENIRVKFSACCITWRSKTAIEKEFYSNEAPGSLTGYQYFISICLKS